MKLIRLKKIETSSLAAIAKELKAGAVIVYPTDTAYALGCDATNAKAVARVFAIKGRDNAKALPMVVADMSMAKKFIVLSSKFIVLSSKHWPGPLTLVAKAKKGIAKAALDQGTAAVRVPNNDIARRLSQWLGRPLIATSANLSGRPTCYSAKAVLRQFAGAARLPDIVLDAGALPKRRPSTIVASDKKGEIIVLRQGPIKIICP